MADPNIEPSRLSVYIKAIVERYVRPISLSLTNTTALLRTLSDATRLNADESQNALDSTQSLLDQFLARYLGVQDSDPLTAPNGLSLVVGSCYVRRSDGRWRYVSQVSPTLIWSDANVLPFPISPGPLTIQGTGNNAGLILDNTLTNLDLRLLQKEDGSFSVLDFTNNLELLNISSSNPVFKGSRIWTAGNDGSGSGLDADILRGLHWTSGQSVVFGPIVGTTINGTIITGSSFGGGSFSGTTINGTIITGNNFVGGSFNGTTINGSAITGTSFLRSGNLVWDAGNDGSGSGLDADMLRGLHWTSGQNVSFGAVDATSFSRSGNTVWDSANDGSGSGLDTDLWRGKTPTQFIADYFSVGSNWNGRWRKSPNGDGTSTLTQYGISAGTLDQQIITITFPTPFANTNYDLQLTAVIPSTDDYDNYFQEINGARTVNGVSIFSHDPSGGGLGLITGCRWRAEGDAP